VLVAWLDLGHFDERAYMSAGVAFLLGTVTGALLLSLTIYAIVKRALTEKFK